MKLFANGCSYTFGGGIYSNYEMDDQENFILYPGSTHPRNLEREKIVWPGQLGEILGAESVTNLSIGAASNARITRTTLDFFYEQISLGVDVTDYLAVIEWSDVSRKEYHSHNQWWLANINGIANDNGYKGGVQPHASITKEQVGHAAYCYRHIYSDMQDVTDAVMHVTALGGFFEKFKIPYVFWTMNGLHYEHVELNKEFESYRYLLPGLEHFTWTGGTIDQSRFAGFGEWDSQCFVSPTDGHPNKLGHHLLAKHIHCQMLGIPGLIK